MKNIMISLTVLLAVLFTESMQAQNTLSLSDAIGIGLENNYDLQIIRKVEEVAEINNTWGNTGIIPSINFSMNGRENYNFNDSEDFRTLSVSSVLSLNWVFFDGFTARITKNKYEELEQQSEGNTAILIESTIQDILLAYNNCILQKEMTAVYQELANLSRDRYDRTRNSEEIGASTTYEILQAKTSWLQDQSNYLEQKVNYENAVRTLNFTLALEDDTEWELVTGLETNTPDYNLTDLGQKLESNNKTLKNQYLYQSMLAKETSLAKSQYYPTLSMNTGVSNSVMDNFYSGSTPDINQNSYDAYVGLSLSFNIFNGGVRKRSVQIAKINEETAGVETAQMEHSLNNQLLQMYSNYQVQKEILVLADEEMAAAKLNLDLSAEKLKNGSINSFNYRDVQNIYMNAAISKFMATYNLVKANTDLLRITGGIISEYE